MKTKINSISKPNTLTFPLVAKAIYGNDSEMLVLFNSERSGVVIHSNQDDVKVGYISDSFFSCFNTKEWEILSEVSVTFTNGN